MGLIIHVDGGSRGNPGPAGAGVVIVTEDGERIHEAGYFLGKQTNNAAEYNAVIRALQRAQRCAESSLCVFSDSQLLVRQITGEYEVKSPTLAKLYGQVQLLLLRIKTWSFRHIPREENRRADQLANLAMDRKRDVVVFDIDDGPSEDAPELDEPLVSHSPASGKGKQSNRGEKAAQASLQESPAALDEPKTALPPEDIDSRAVRVKLSRAPSEDVCPVGLAPPWEVTVGSALPPGICVHAAHGIVTAALAMLNTDPDEFLAVPTLTVRCSRPGCGAQFLLSPLRSPNGSKRSDK